MRERDQARETLLTLGLLLQHQQRLTHGDGHKRGRRGGEDEPAAAIDHEIAQHSRGRDQRARGAQRLAAGVNDHEVLAPFIGCGHPSPLLAVDAGAVRLVHHQERVVPLGDGDEILERRDIAIHAVDALDHDPDPSVAALGAPAANGVFDRLGIIVRADPELRSARPRTFMDAGVHQGIEHQQVAALWQRRQHGEIGDVAAAEEQCGLGAEERGGLGFEAFMLLSIAAQQPRAAGTDRRAGLERGRDGVLDARRVRERQIVARDEIDARARLEAAQPTSLLRACKAAA